MESGRTTGKSNKGEKYPDVFTLSRICTQSFTTCGNLDQDYSKKLLVEYWDESKAPFIAFPMFKVDITDIDFFSGIYYFISFCVVYIKKNKKGLNENRIHNKK